MGASELDSSRIKSPEEIPRFSKTGDKEALDETFAQRQLSDRKILVEDSKEQAYHSGNYQNADQ